MTKQENTLPELRAQLVTSEQERFAAVGTAFRRLTDVVSQERLGEIMNEKLRSDLGDLVGDLRAIDTAGLSHHAVVARSTFLRVAERILGEPQLPNKFVRGLLGDLEQLAKIDLRSPLPSPADREVFDIIIKVEMVALTDVDTSFVLNALEAGSPDEVQIARSVREEMERHAAATDEEKELRGRIDAEANRRDFHDRDKVSAIQLVLQ